MTDIGATLRAAREEQGLSLADVEARTRIRARMLDALENNELDLVRGDPHLRGFLRNYATFLGLDPRPMFDSLGVVTDRPLPQPRSTARDPYYLAEPLQTNPVPLGRILFTLAFLLLLGLAAFYLWGPQSFRDTLLASANRIAGPTPSPGITAIVSPTPGVEATETPIVVTQTITTTIIEPFRSPTPEDGGATPVPTATLPPRTATPDPEEVAAAETATAQAQAETYEGVVLRAEFIEDSYIYLQADDNPDLIFDGVLPAGHVAEWRGNVEIYITIGNAGGVRVNVNGQDLGILGEPGEVVERTWSVDPEGGPPIEETFD